VPENLLRVYLEFSAPMGGAPRILDPDCTRYTLFFDPGRVKRKALPNRQSGRPLRAVRRSITASCPGHSASSRGAAKRSTGTRRRADRRSVFTPIAPWARGEYNLVAQPFLEDSQGNRIGRAFEAPDASAGGSTDDAGLDAYRVAFSIRSARP
jgi:hypothetical protein